MTELIRQDDLETLPEAQAEDSKRNQGDIRLTKRSHGIRGSTPPDGGAKDSTDRPAQPSLPNNRGCLRNLMDGAWMEL